MAQSRSPAEIARDRVLISELYLRHKRQDEIAAELKMSQSTVSRDLKALQALWLERSVMNIDAAKAQALASIDNLERVYWDAWISSKGQFKTTTRKQIMRAARAKPVPADSQKEGDKPKEPAPDIASQEMTEHTETLTGDPRFLDGVMDCIRRRCEILGIDAPKKTDLTTGGQKLTQPITTVEIVKQYERPNDEQ